MVLVLEKHRIRRQQLKKTAVPALKKKTTASSKVVKQNNVNISKVKPKEKVTEHKPVEAEQNNGQYELNELMNRVIEDELQNIMIKVWQTLPDEPSSEVERLVTERLRYDVSDDLRNVLGLNVSKRLLNVFNPLYVKMHFSRRPENGCLTDFLKKYNLTNFQRVTKDQNVFTARTNNITDFDKLCTSKDIQCGSAKITVTQSYKFTECPAKLKTVFFDRPEDDEKVDNSEFNINLDNIEKGVPREKKETKVPLNDIKPVKVTNSVKEQVPNNIKLSKKEEIGNIKIENALIAGNNITPAKSGDINKANNATITKHNERIQNEETEPKQKANSAKETIVVPGPNKISEPKLNIINVETEIADKTNNVTNANKVQKNIATPTKTNTSMVNKETIAAKNATPRKQRNTVKNIETLNAERFDENEEMDDVEIFALISSGLVVDECSGSGEE